jgi:hypothetical protein
LIHYVSESTFKAKGTHLTTCKNDECIIAGDTLNLTREMTKEVADLAIKNPCLRPSIIYEQVRDKMNAMAKEKNKPVAKFLSRKATISLVNNTRYFISRSRIRSFAQIFLEMR